MTFDYIKAVDHARSTTRSPIVAIPILGGAPFAVRRSVLAESLKGLTVIDAAIQLPLDGKREHSQLIVYAVGEHVQAVRKFNPLRMYDVRMALWDWADKERAKRAKPKVPKTTAREKEIAKLEKKLAKMGMPRPPVHPFAPSQYRDEAQRIKEHDARELAAWFSLLAGGSEMEQPETCAEEWRTWKRQANVRRWVQFQARECMAGRINTGALYKRLQERGLEVKKWSELRTYDKEQCHGELREYLGKLWQFCGLRSKPHEFRPVEEEYYTYGPELYAGWLERLHEYKELAGMIAGLREVNGL